MKRLGLVIAVASSALLVGIAQSAASNEGVAVAGPTIDDLISKCPTAAEIAAIRSDFSLSFEGDPTAGTLVCRASDGSVDLTRLQERAIQALRAMKVLSFVRPLPWTAQGLYDWLNGAIDGIRFRSDITYSYCCDPPGVVNIQTRNLGTLLPGDRWVNPENGASLASLIGLYIHEARHNQGKGHTCSGSQDATITEMGSWGVQYYYYLWLGLYAGEYLAAASPSPTYYRDQAILFSEMTLPTICSLPSADLALSIASSPVPVPSGGTLQTMLTVRNLGPDTAPKAFVAFDETPDVALAQSASASQGSCLVGEGGEPRGTSCALGSIAPGAAATITIVQKVTGSEGAVIQAPVSPQLSIGPYVTGPVRDANTANNAGQFSVLISTSGSAAPPSIPSPGNPAPPSAGCAGAPKGGVTKVGPSGGGRVVGTSKGDVLCSGGGVTTLEGRGGDDVLRGGAGRDRVLAATGNDTVYVRGGKTDFVQCGSGRDVVLADRPDRVARDCESIKRG